MGRWCIRGEGICMRIHQTCNNVYCWFLPKVKFMAPWSNISFKRLEWRNIELLRTGAILRNVSSPVARYAPSAVWGWLTDRRLRQLFTGFPTSEDFVWFNPNYLFFALSSLFNYWQGNCSVQNNPGNNHVISSPDLFLSVRNLRNEHCYRHVINTKNSFYDSLKAIELCHDFFSKSVAFFFFNFYLHF